MMKYILHYYENNLKDVLSILEQVSVTEALCEILWKVFRRFLEHSMCLTKQ